MRPLIPADTRVDWRGVKITARQREALRAAERRLQKKFKGVVLMPSQGSWHDGALSGGTHTGAGAVDLRVQHMSVEQIVFAMRCIKDVGQAAWLRPYNWDGNGGGAHIHLLDRVTRGMAASAKWQVAQNDAGRSGLTSNRPDRTYRPKYPVKWDYRAGMPVPD